VGSRRVGSGVPGYTSAMEDRDTIPPDELDGEDAELLPDRQAMSIITPGFERPVPLDPVDPGGPFESE
jgi:hypothetical protein